MPSKSNRVRKMVHKLTPPIRPLLMNAFGTMNRVRAAEQRVANAKRDVKSEKYWAANAWRTYLGAPNRRRVQAVREAGLTPHNMRENVKIAERHVGRAIGKEEEAHQQLNQKVELAQRRRRLISNIREISLLNPRTAYRFARQKIKNFVHPNKFSGGVASLRLALMVSIHLVAWFYVFLHVRPWNMNRTSSGSFERQRAHANGNLFYF